jgi:glycerol uptake facilitator protein
MATKTETDEAQAPLGRRLGAEFIGSLLFIGIGTGAATVLTAGPLLRLETLRQGQNLLQGPTPDATAAQERIFAAIFSNSLADTLGVALAFAFGLAVMVYAFGRISGAHFNPAVTLGLAIARRFPVKEVPLYWLAQCLGGVAGAFVVAGIYRDSGARVGKVDVLFGATTVSPDINFWQAVLAEALIAFILVIAIMALAVDRRAPKGWSGLMIGLALAAGILVTGAATGGSANFARSLGPLVASLPFDVSSIPWSDLYVYALGPAIGAAAAALLYESLSGLEPAAPAPSPGAASPVVTEEEASAAPATWGGALGTGGSGPTRGT